MARTGHKSSFAGLILSGARPVYFDPYYDEELEIALTPVAADLTAALDDHQRRVRPWSSRRAITQRAPTSPAWLRRAARAISRW